MKNDAQDLAGMTEVVLQQLCTYLTNSQAGKGKVIQQLPPAELAEKLQLQFWIQQGGFHPDAAAQWLGTYLSNTQHMHHPHYIGHQVSVPHVASGIADLIHGVANNPMAIYEMGPAATIIEQLMINWLLNQVGWFKGKELSDFRKIEGNGGGVLTHGGSMANLTALLSARAAIAPEAWQEGNPSDLVVLVPQVSHYSVARAVSIMGLGEKAIIPVEVDDLERLQPESLLPVYRQLKDQGKRVMAVVANACATSTGLYDPLDEIGHFCAEHELWFHVDGAHGAAALLSPRERHLMKGAERADSMIWDMHKMLRTSTLCAAVLFKDQGHLAKTFQQKASYLFTDSERVGFDLMPYALECTKSGIGTKLFWVLAAEGEKGLRQYIDNQYGQTRRFYELIKAQADFECPYMPEANILCFRYTKFGTDNDFQLAIRDALVSRGNYYISSTELRGERYLRLAVMNPLTEARHIEGLLREITVVAAQLNQSTAGAAQS